MNILLDAWLDRVNPLLRIIDRNTGNELFRWDGVRLNTAIDTGLICTADLEKHPITDKELLNLIACMGN